LTLQPETIVLPIPDGRTATALLFGGHEKPRPALIIIHEWWGVNDEMRDQAARFSKEGFVTLVPDLYFGSWTTDQERAAQLSSEMKTAVSMEIVRSAVNALAEDRRTTKRIGITGFCLGGGMALAAACTVPGIGAAVPFYGTPRDEFLHFSKDTPPIQGHYAKYDDYVDGDRVARIQRTALDANTRFDVFFYEAGHAFLRRSDPAVHDRPSAELAWGRAVTFLHTHLGE